MLLKASLVIVIPGAFIALIGAALYLTISSCFKEDIKLPRKGAVKRLREDHETNLKRKPSPELVDILTDKEKDDE